MNASKFCCRIDEQQNMSTMKGRWIVKNPKNVKKSDGDTTKQRQQCINSTQLWKLNSEIVMVLLEINNFNFKYCLAVSLMTAIILTIDYRLNCNYND